jgi:hypothetical protein
MSVYPLDEEVKLDGENPKEGTVQAVLGSFTESQGEIKWTPRMLGKKITLGGFHPSEVGTPEMIADEMEKVCCHVEDLARGVLTGNSGLMKQTSMASTLLMSAIPAPLKM